MAKTLFKSLSYELSQLLGDIDLGKLALPELQRPFVWKNTDVRNLFDSMYRGFPVGYLMLWNAAETDFKFIGVDGKQHTPSEFIIDGQQRLTSLYAVMKGVEVTFKDFSTGVIRIAFRPRDGSFEVTDPAHEGDPEFLADITTLFTGANWEVIEAFIDRLRTAKPEMLANGEETALRNALGRLNGLQDYPFLAVQVGHEVDEEDVAEIFLRVNSGGTFLTQADFILTLLSVFREEDRRRLEEFAQLATKMPDAAPSPYNHLVAPAADQLLRVAVLVAFQRGRLRSVLALLRGGGVDGDGALTEDDRNAQLDKLTGAIDKVLDLTNWHEYLKVLMSAGFRRSTEISSQNNLMLVYALYLVGRHTYGLSHTELRTTIARYFFMSSLTARYTGSFETQITQDIQAFTTATSGDEYLEELRQTIDATLTSDFWSITLPRDLATSAARAPGLFAYAAALCLLNARVPPFVTVAGSEGKEQKAAVFLRDLFDPVIQPKKNPVERHHLFPRKYLEGAGIVGTRRVNQIGNLSYVEWPENIEISDTAPRDYWPRYAQQFTEDDIFHHALPDGWATMDYEAFLVCRRSLIADVIHRGFESIGKTPTAGGEHPLIPTAVSDTYLTPAEPFSNDLAVRRIIRKLHGNVLWYEQHMDRKVLELLADELDLENVHELRLMSGPAHLTTKTKRAFERFATELENRGVPCDWRVLSADAARAFHARVLTDDSQTFELPPLNSVLAGTVDSIRTSQMPLGAFEKAWSEEAVSLLQLESLV